MRRSTGGALAVALTLACAPVIEADEAGAAAAPDKPVSAVWVEHEAAFTYFGYTSYYSCDGLRSKVRHIMREVGARDDLEVTMRCLEPTGPEPMPNVRIKAALPAAATPEVLAKLAEDAPKRELVARAQGKSGGVDTATAQFPAAWRRVEFSGRRNQRIEPGDCELLEQMVRHVFEPMGLRVAPESRLACVPHQAGVGSVNLKLDTLQRLPEPDPAKADQSSSGKPPE